MKPHFLLILIVLWSLKAEAVNDTIIDAVNMKFLGNTIVGAEKTRLIGLYFRSFEKSEERHPMLDGSIAPSEEGRMTIKPYNARIPNIQAKLYHIDVAYEDGKYTALFAVSDFSDSLLLFERLDAEAGYVVSATVQGNIISLKSNLGRRNQVSQYLFSDGFFRQYFDKAESAIDRKWGEALSDHGQYEYLAKGMVKNHLKQGHWEERRYLPEYDKAVWLDGDYVDGLRHGQWNYAPDGPTEKTETYDMGKLVKTEMH